MTVTASQLLTLDEKWSNTAGVDPGKVFKDTMWSKKLISFIIVSLILFVTNKIIKLIKTIFFVICLYGFVLIDDES